MSERELRQEIAQLRAEIDRVDNWANGIFLVLQEVLPPLLKKNPEIASHLRDSWRAAAEKLDDLERGVEQRDDPEEAESLESLEVRKILYRTLDLLGVWPKPGRG